MDDTVQDPQQVLSPELANPDAALRIRQHYQINASPQSVFELIGNLEGISRFFPMIYHASVSRPYGKDGEGCERVCSIRGMGKVKEQVVWWEQPLGYAYRAKGRMVPLKDHLGIILLKEDQHGNTLLEWRQYFNSRFGPMGWIFAVMMRILMKQAIYNISKILHNTQH